MTTVAHYIRSFNGGEVTPEFFGRLDDQKYQTGLAECLNFVVLPHGPVQNRGGFELVRETSRARVIPFVFSPTQSWVLEMRVGTFRFHTNGQTLLNPAGTAPYEIAHPYLEAELFDVRYTQSGDVVTLVHPNHPPAELRRLSASTWEYEPISFGAEVSAPTGVAAAEVQVGTQPTEPQPLSYEYVVTATGPGGTESAPSAVASAATDFFQTTNRIDVTWSAVTGATGYRVYRRQSGAFGLVSQTVGLEFSDTNSVAPDFTRTPPLVPPVPPFSAPGDYPAAVGYNQQRRWFGGSINSPVTVSASKTGTESDFSFSVPTVDTDSFSFRIAARDGAPLVHLVPLQDFLALTGSAEWRVSDAGGGVITPTSISARVQSYVGAGPATPAVVNNVCVYAAARGGHVRQLGFSDERGGFVTLDLSLRAPHLFDSYDIVDMAFAKAPIPVLWAVSSSGRLLGLTYIPEEEVWAWHQHETAGVFESVCVVPEGDYDALYAVIRRDLNYGTVRFVERMAPRLLTTENAGFFVDCGLRYSGPPVATVGGLSHLRGETVSIVSDGAVHPPRTVASDGTVVLERPASELQVGLPYVASMQTLPVSLETQGFAQGRAKNIDKVHLKLYLSSGVFAGVAGEELVELKHRTTEPFGTPPRLVSGEFEIVPRGNWTRDGAIRVEQRAPLPLTVLALTAEVVLGGG